MPLYRRTFVAACVLVPLFYIYWWRFAIYGTSGGLRGRLPSEDVFNKTLGFSKIFVINLPSRTDRRDAMALAGAVSNLTFTWVDGVSGNQVMDPTTPVSNGVRSPGAKGSWRSHMNALQAVVRDNLGSALIVEDDIDWDIRLKSQLQTFASASRTWLRKSKSDNHPAEIFESNPSPLQKNRGIVGSKSEKDTIQLDLKKVADGGAYQTAYGDDWDVLWLGHCGTDFPSDQSSVPPLRIAIPDDDTVPVPKHLKPHPFALQDKLGEIYPPHTRVVHASSGTVCSLAYAVSLQGARKLLLEFDAHYDSQWDLMLQKWCEGGYAAASKSRAESESDSDGNVSHDHREAPLVCLTVQPPLFSHHYAKGGASNIQGQGGGYAKGTGTPYIRLSVRENLKRLVTGAPESQMVDQLPDDGEPIWK
ncbi:glycosyltransferase family 25 protein [Annulohypoxylon bovei var. microspora]|nr:glycosyltransferase family 25 protein [Annulohypoxylon bovei var. microspora]